MIKRTVQTTTMGEGKLVDIDIEVVDKRVFVNMLKKRYKAQLDTGDYVDAWNEFMEVIDYIYKGLTGKTHVNAYRLLGYIRFIDDIRSDKWDYRFEKGYECSNFIRQNFKIPKGSDVGKPLELLTWMKFVVYNLECFYIKGSYVSDRQLKRFTESFIYIPRKNAKTSSSSAYLKYRTFKERWQGCETYLLGNAMQQALQSFNTMLYETEELKKRGLHGYKILNSQNAREIKYEDEEGTFLIKAMANNVNTQDSYDAVIAYLDEVHAYKNVDQVSLWKQALKARDHKLLYMTTTGGTDLNSYCYDHVVRCKKLLQGVLHDDSIFILIAESDNPSEYTNPIEHEKANPSYGEMIKPHEILQESYEAMENPRLRNKFLNKSLNIYTNATNAYFDYDELMRSNNLYLKTTIEDILAKKPIWYGGADMSKSDDLTATALYTEVDGIGYIYAHGYLPQGVTHIKEKDGIPHVYWEEKDWLTICKGNIIDYDDVVKWFKTKRTEKFRIHSVSYDKQYADDVILGLERANIKVRNQIQNRHRKHEGFRYFEQMLKAQKLYFFSNEAYRYCVLNVQCVEDNEDVVKFGKIGINNKIDLFDASIMAILGFIQNKKDVEKQNKRNKVLKSQKTLDN